MKPIKFKGYNKILAEDQPEYLPLPVYKDEEGTMTSCWELTLGERIKLLFTGKLFISQLTFNRPLQPQLPSIDWEIEENNQIQIK